MTDMPTWEEFMIPTLRVLSDGVIRHWREFQPLVADEANLTDEQKIEMLPSGNQLKYQNRIGWGGLLPDERRRVGTPETRPLPDHQRR
jgi:restriction system protein